MDVDKKNLDHESLQAGAQFWKRNLAVCCMGSFSTIIAMTLLLPFLPLYVEQLGVTDRAAIVQWSGAAYGATFFTAAVTAPLWAVVQNFRESATKRQGHKPSHAASTAFQISGARLSLMRSRPSLN
jgi:MFS family permease